MDGPPQGIIWKNPEVYFQYNNFLQCSNTDRKLTNDSISIIKLEDNLVPVPF